MNYLVSIFDKKTEENLNFLYVALQKLLLFYACFYLTDTL